MQTITVASPTATQEIGERLGKLVQAGDVLLLDGDLGAGKTTFTKGLAVGLGIPVNVKSPTFTIIREYQQGRIPLYHMDVYRLEDGGGEELGLDEYFAGDGVSVVEWSQFVADELPSEYLTIHIKRTAAADDQRTLAFEPHGDHYAQLVAALHLEDTDV